MPPAVVGGRSALTGGTYRAMALAEAASGSGAHVRRKDGDLVLTGRGGYLEDVQLPGMLHAVLLRSSEADADLVEIATEAARNAPGVRMVMLGAELAEHLPAMVEFVDLESVGGRPGKLPALAVDKVCYEGQPVAVVVAET